MASFQRELNRRQVLKVGGVYVLVAVATVEAADLLFPRLALPDWTVTLVVALAVVGLPLALVLAWAYEITPGGIRRDHGTGGPTPETKTPPEASPASTDAAGPAPSVAGSSSQDESTHAASPGSGSSVAANPSPDPKSVAVLPFADMSAAGDQEYLADGLAEEILNGLARLKDLRVAARTSSFAFKGRAEHVRELGRELEVAHVLEGSVRKWGDRVRVTAQLISVRDGYHLWSETYDRQLDDIFAIQDDIARSIVEKLQVELLEEERAGSLVAEHTGDPEAYDLYLKGRHAWYNRYRVGLQTALAYFEQAREKDPAFALAHCGVADTYSVLGLYGLMSPDQARRRSRTAADRALELAPELPEAVFSDAFQVAFLGGRPDWEGALEGFRRAWEMRPDYAEALAWHGIVLATRGVDPDEEVFEVMRKARAIDPDSAYVADLAGLGYIWIGRPKPALEEFDFALSSNPEDTIALYGMGNALMDLGRAEESIAHLRKSVELTNRASAFLGMLGFAVARAGRLDEGRDILAELLERERGGYVLPAVIAGVAANVGEEGIALDHLEEAADMERHPAPTWWLRFHIWDAVEDHPRFRAILEELGMVLPAPIR